jgi:hypothetical protein
MYPANEVGSSFQFAQEECFKNSVTRKFPKSDKNMAQITHSFLLK